MERVGIDEAAGHVGGAGKNKRILFGAEKMWVGEGATGIEP
jgi:hypothetical protein